MNEEAKYKGKGREKYPSPLHEVEIAALKTVIKMAEGNLHCRQTNERKNPLKVLKNMI